MDARTKEIHLRIREKSRGVKDPAGRDVRILEDDHALQIAEEFGQSLHEVYVETLVLGICPYRYLRNHDAISLMEQLQLAKAQVAVVGVGGIGGQVVLLLARVGIGRLVVVDHDLFDETNLNRQALSSKEAVGKSKSREAVLTLAAINPGVEVRDHQIRLDASRAQKILAGSHVIIDALDNIPDRMVLEKAAKTLGIPLVHGALAGFQGQMMTVYPEDVGLEQIYGGAASREEGFTRPESILGVPCMAPSIIATLQAMEVLKIILKRGKILRNTLAHVDLEQGEFTFFSFQRGDR